jgi:hypothetical protein
MTIDNQYNEIPASLRVQNDTKMQPESNQGNVQQSINEQMLREATNGNSSPNKAMMQLLMSVQPQKQIQNTARNQISKGYLDVKV